MLKRNKGKNVLKDKLPSKTRRRNMNLSVIKTGINLTQIEDQVALLLHAHGAVPEHSEVMSIDFGTPDDQGVVPLEVTIQQRKEVYDRSKST